MLETVRGAARRLYKFLNCAFECNYYYYYYNYYYYYYYLHRLKISHSDECSCNTGPQVHNCNCLVGLVVRRPPRERKIPGSNPGCAGIFWGSSHTSDFKIGTPVATLPGASRYRVSTGTGWPGVSILWLGEVERLICNFYLSVAARKKILKLSKQIRPWDTLACCWDVKQPTNNHNCILQPCPGYYALKFQTWPSPGNAHWKPWEMLKQTSNLATLASQNI